jgi:hypothetical protein
VKCQPASDAVQGITSKFQRPYEGPYLFQRSINPAIYELCDTEGKIRGIFNIKHLKPYLSGRDLSVETEKSLMTGCFFIPVIKKKRSSANII